MKWRNTDFYVGGCGVVDHYHRQRTEVASADRRARRALCSGGRSCPAGSGKEDHADISKVRYLRCKKAVGPVRV